MHGEAAGGLSVHLDSSRLRVQAPAVPSDWVWGSLLALQHQLLLLLLLLLPGQSGQQGSHIHLLWWSSQPALL